MRRRLVLVFVAVSAMVAFAFVVPLGFLVRNTAEDRAIDAARADASAVTPALVAGTTRIQIEAAVGATASGREGRMTVVTASGATIGPPVAESSRIDMALMNGTSDIGPVSGGVEVVAAVATGPGELSAVRVFVANSELRRGQWQAWSALGFIAAALIGISVVVADRLARTVVLPTQRLATAAQRLGDGDLQARVEPDGPIELVELSRAFNNLGSQVGSMLARERELVAELSHRLRTPLTKLRLRLDQVEHDELADELRRDVDDVTGVVNELIREARHQLETSRSQCDLAEVVTDRAEFWSVLADDQLRPWRFDQYGGPVWVSISATDLAAAIDVLIENVFSHTPDGTALAIGFRADDSAATVSVSDAGDGFESSVLGRGESGADSTGLGLDIARQTAQAAGGRLELSTSSMGGACVSMIIPIDAPPRPQ